MPMPNVMAALPNIECKKSAEICWRVWGTPTNFNKFRVLAALLLGTEVVGIIQALRR